MTIAGENDHIIDLVPFDEVEDARPGSTVAIPCVLEMVAPVSV
jgi:hypothetical protein